MNIIKTELPEVLLIEPSVHKDERGHFLEIFQQQHFNETLGPFEWTQDNVSSSKKGTVRGLHFQWPKPQGKLVTVMAGEIFDVAVDIRVGSPSFGQWVGQFLDDRSHRQLWIPPGFAHGFLVLSDTADLEYKCSEFYDPEDERQIRWNDPELNIAWPIKNPILSVKDSEAPALSDCFI